MVAQLSGCRTLIWRLWRTPKLWMQLKGKSTQCKTPRSKTLNKNCAVWTRPQLTIVFPYSFSVHHSDSLSCGVGKGCSQSQSAQCRITFGFCTALCVPGMEWRLWKRSANNEQTMRHDLQGEGWSEVGALNAALKKKTEKKTNCPVLEAAAGPFHSCCAKKSRFVRRTLNLWDKRTEQSLLLFTYSGSFLFFPQNKEASVSLEESYNNGNACGFHFTCISCNSHCTDFP